MEEEKFYTIILRHDESTKWMINNPILALGEYGVEDDTHRIKRGDGKSKWSELNYEHFGLEYMITYGNLQGKVEDNVALKSALDTKISYEVFSDIQNSVIAGLTIHTEDGKIGKITKTTKDVATAGTKQNYLLIQSTDQSVQGFWSIDEQGIKILDLKANAAIDDYEPKRKYYVDQICFYDNKLYRAITDFEAGVVFNPEQWVILASLHSSDIKYDNKVSGLESKTVKTALDELKDLDDEKVQKTRRPYRVYGTDEDGEQMLYDKDELRTVDSVNGIEADPTSKNIQIDADDINYNDEAETKQTIKEVLDSKVDKVIAGEGAKIVRDVTLNYNEENGSIELVEDKVSLEDGSSKEQRTSVDVVSEQELTNAKSELQANIDANKQEINNRIDQEVADLNTTISNNKEDIENKLQDAKTELQTNIDNTEAEINNRIDQEVADLNTTITANKAEINTKVDNIKSETDQTIADNKADIEDKLQKGLDTKIDKDIADSIVTDVRFSNEKGDKLNEPTLKITSKNTDTETEVIHHMHFKQKGDLNITRENDHLLFDSSAIDLKVKTNADKIATHDTEIAALQEHDLNHDRLLATHTEQIANHETRVAANEEHLVEVDTTIAQMKEQHSNDINEVKTVNANQEAHLTRLDQTDDEHDERIQANADALVETNKNVASNLRRINENQAAIESNDADILNLQTNKADKIFAQDANNKVAGDIKFESLTGNEIAKLGLVDIDPTNNSGASRQLTFKSTDNTLVSVPVTDEEGNIIGYDLATNLDIDVNYFVTTQILNTTIPSENIVSFDSLTSTDKEKVELHDIISDSEGTWSRVKSIDEEAGTCVTITYAKHAQAVWGTVKGNIADQADLQVELAKKINKNISSHVVTEINYSGIGTNYNNLNEIRFTYRLQPTNGSGGHTATPMTWAKSDSILITRGQGTNPITYRFKVEAEGVEFKPKESGLTSTLLAPAVRELKALDDEKVLITDFETFKTENTTNINNLINTAKSELQTNIDNEATARETKDNEILSSIEDLQNTKLDMTHDTKVIYGTDETGKQMLYHLEDFGTVDTVNGIGVDEYKNILITADDIEYDNSLYTPEWITQANTIQAQLDILMEHVDYLRKVTTLASRVWSLDRLYTEADYRDICGEELKVGDFFMTTSANKVVLMAHINNIPSINPTDYTKGYDYFKALVQVGDIDLVGIPEQTLGSSEVSSKLTGVIPGTLVSGLWADETSTADFVAYDGENNVIASKTLKRADIEIVTYREMECVQFKLDLAEGQTIDTAKENCHGLRISATHQGQTASQTFQFVYDMDNDIFHADRWPL